MKGEIVMKFNYEKKEFVVNVDEVFEKATKDDYIDYLDAFGVIIHTLQPEMPEGLVVVMVYDDAEDEITIEIISISNEETYVDVSEKEIVMTEEERNLIVEKMEII